MIGIERPERSNRPWPTLKTLVDNLETKWTYLRDTSAIWWTTLRLAATLATLADDFVFRDSFGNNFSAGF